MAMMMFEMAGLAEHLALLVQTGLSDMAKTFANPCCVSQAIRMVEVERLVASPTALADTLRDGFRRDSLG